MEMEKEARKLQDDLAFTDMLMAPSRGGDFVEMAIKKLQRLVVRMEADHHARAHVHIDYGRERHAASFAVDNGERLVGRMPTKYGRDVQTWIIQNQSRLQALTPRSGEYSRLKGCPVSLDHYRLRQSLKELLEVVDEVLHRVAQRRCGSKLVNFHEQGGFLIAHFF